MVPPPTTMMSSNNHQQFEVTEDTPVDFLEGCMEILVVFPNEKSILMSIQRRYPFHSNSKMNNQPGSKNRFVVTFHQVFFFFIQREKHIFLCDKAISGLYREFHDYGTKLVIGL